MAMTSTEKRFRDQTLRPTAIVGLAGVALVHLLDLQDTYKEVPWVGIAFGLLIAGALFSAAWLLDVRTQRGWVLAAVVSALGFAAFAISRTTGLPGATNDIGNWLEPLGLANMFSEGLVFLMSAYALVALRPVVPTEAVEAERSADGHRDGAVSRRIDLTELPERQPV
jgi:hypothetical protein